jgi:hypothetical protein
VIQQEVQTVLLQEGPEQSVMTALQAQQLALELVLLMVMLITGYADRLIPHYNCRIIIFNL